MAITLGSLFDGIGVFPFRSLQRMALFPYGQVRLRKSLFLSQKKHFTQMQHLGDITKLDGAKIPPVHIITFGSPCQNLSTIGAREDGRRKVRSVSSCNPYHTGNEVCD